MDDKGFSVLLRWIVAPRFHIDMLRGMMGGGGCVVAGRIGGWVVLTLTPALSLRKRGIFFPLLFCEFFECGDEAPELVLVIL